MLCIISCTPHSQKEYDAQMAVLVNRYLKMNPPAALYSFLKCRFSTLKKKHGGVVGGAACWAMLMGFNLSRAAFWSLLQIGGRARAKERAHHFRNVVVSLGKLWPAT